MRVTSRDSSSDISGRIEGSRRASIVLPDPGGPQKTTLGVGGRGFGGGDRSGRPVFPPPPADRRRDWLDAIVVLRVDERLNLVGIVRLNVVVKTWTQLSSP
jgi:hypothetical protein